MLSCTKVVLQDHAAETQDTLADAVEMKHDCFFDYDALESDDEFADEIGYNSATSTCEDEIGYNSAISTCEKDQQCSGAHCTAERQCNVVEGPPAGPLKPKNMKGALEETNTINSDMREKL